MEPFAAKEGMEGTGLLELRPWRCYAGVTVGFTTRHGGMSRKPYASLNAGLHVADEPQDVVANRQRIAEHVGIPFERWVYGEQVHDCRVAVVTAADQGRGTRSRETALADTDAFITHEPGLCLAALYADCVPLYFYDPVHHAGGLAHAGWKGTVLQIAKRTVEALGEAFGSRPEQLVAAIGPSIGACCYEVDEQVIAKVDGLKLPGSLYETLPSGKYMLDLQECNRQIMIKAGILPTSIERSHWCTSCRTDRFFSHRKENGRTGRMLAWFGLLRAEEAEGIR